MRFLSFKSQLKVLSVIDLCQSRVNWTHEIVDNQQLRYERKSRDQRINVPKITRKKSQDVFTELQLVENNFRENEMLLKNSSIT